MDQQAVSRKNPGDFAKNSGKTLIFVVGQRQHSG
jgi:hypothetical protein